MRRIIKVRRLQCPKCGIRPRHDGWQQCRECLEPVWRAGGRKSARSRKRKGGLTAFATFVGYGPVEAEIEARLGKLPPEQERSS